MKAGKARTHLRPSLQNTKALLMRAIFRVISPTLKKRAKPAPTSAPQSAKHESLAHAGDFSRNFPYAEKAGKARTHLRPSLQNMKTLLTRAIFRVISHVLV